MKAKLDRKDILVNIGENYGFGMLLSEGLIIF